MSEYEKIWVNMRKFGEIWEILGKYGIIQGKYGKYEENMRFEGNIGK